MGVVGKGSDTRIWTEAREAQFARLSATKQPDADMARQLGVSLNALRCHRNVLRHRQAQAQTPTGTVIRMRPGPQIRPPLPAGHPITWGLITDQPWPGPPPSA